MAASSNLRLFLDSNVIISGFFSPQGPSGNLLQLHLRKKIDVIVCQLVIEEVIRNVHEKKPAAFAELQAFLIKSPPVIVPNPAVHEIKRWTATLLPEDAAVLAAAINANPDYFVTGDNHFYQNPSIQMKSGLHIVTPAQSLKYYKTQG